MGTGQEAPPTGSSAAPALLLVGGHDPSGGAGLAADLEVCAAWRRRAYSIPSCLTVQDGARFVRQRPCSLEDAQDSLELLARGGPLDLCKAGLLPNPAWAAWLARRVQDQALRLVLDPVLRAGVDGSAMAGEDMAPALVQELLPRALLATPNRAELAALSGVESWERGVAILQAAGCPWVLVTGADAAAGKEVRHWLHGPGGYAKRFAHPRLEGVFHGSGCTLATACACALARGKPVPEAVGMALDYSFRALQHAWPAPGGGVPRRGVAPPCSPGDRDAPPGESSVS